MRILFMGTPEFAVPSLRKLVENGHDVCGVFTQPDKPKNRGMKLQPTPVKEFAIAHNIPVFQPVKLRDGTALAEIQKLAPELIVVAAYGRILPSEILNAPKLGCINVHSSILPRYRGAAPINWAILNGDAVTGVTIMDMAEELDAGDIIRTVSTPIGPEETADDLTMRLAELGGDALIEAITDIENGTAVHTPQDSAAATFAPMLSKELSAMNWERTAQELNCQVRGLIPWPAAVTFFGGIRCKVFQTTILSDHTEEMPGTILDVDGAITVACGGGTVLRIDVLQPDSSKRMSAADFLRGHKLQIGTIAGNKSN